MNPKLSKILEAIQQSAQLSAEEKAALAKSVADANKDFEITAFKLERTEKVKQTTAILLEETIAELEQKRLAVEKQNQELEVESALERLRTQAMGMQKADDLPGICEILFNEFRNLGFRDLRNAMINIHDDENGSFMNYDYSDAIGKTITPLTYDIHPLVAKQMKQIRSKDDAFSETAFAGEDLKTWIAFRKSAGEPDDIRIEKAEALHYYFYSIGTGSIGISTFTPINPENQKVLLRFRNVFEFAYRRYLEVTQAEEQAREAQIELSLERVRARAMAMRNSSELAELVDTVFKELTKLHMVLDRCIITVIDEKSSTVQYWMANPEVDKTASSYLIRLDELPYFKASLEAWKQRKPKWVYDLKGEEKKQTVEYIFSKTELRFLPEEARQGMKQTDRIFLNSSFSNFGSVQVDTIEPMSDENLDILYRFGKVFDLTYTRFNDLKQAEAQAKEALIEAALERVRSRSLAMHKSTELLEVADVLFRQLRTLGGKMWSSGVVLCEPGSAEDEVWMANEKGVLPPIIVPNNADPTRIALHQGWMNKDEQLSITKEGPELKAHYDYMLSVPSVRPLFEKVRASGLSFPEKQTWHAAYFKYGYLLAITLEPEHDQEIFLRFTRVFEQAYIRFLDLQKAEAQAREAQIETGLERVRSRSLAMHHTSELQEVIHTVHKELLNLNIAIHGGSFIVINSDVDTMLRCWGSGGTADTSEEVTIPQYEKPFLTNLINGIRSGPGFFTEEYTQEEKRDFFEFLFRHQPWSELDAERKKETLSGPGGYSRSCCVSQYTSIFIINHSGEKFSAADNEILKRFGRVFEQTYTRFLDLQKAEAQARESQIEAALEKIRSRAMAMYTSRELEEVALELRRQMGLLGQKDLEVCAIHLYNEEEEHFESWSAMRLPGNEGQINLGRAKFPRKGIRIVDELMGHYKAGTKDYILVNDAEKIVEWFGILKVYTPELYESIMKGVGSMPLTEMKAYWSVADFSGGALIMVTYSMPDEQSRNLLRRTSNVFELAYTRFLDLKKAEAQAMEARIEAALERVRSRSMGMQKSEELKEVVKIVYQQLTHLKINLDHAGFVVDYTPFGDWHFWIADEQDIPAKITHPHFESVWAKQFIEAKEKSAEIFTTHLDFEEKNKFYNDLLSYIPGLPQVSKDFYLNCPGLAASTVLFENVSLYIENFSGIPYSDEENNTLMRFGKVFQQTYTRFLDLQKAEAQARESRIEAALEKVRSRTMAMQRSDELSETAAVLFQEFKNLGEEEMLQITIGLYDEVQRQIEFRVTSWAGDGQLENRAFNLSMEEPTLLKPIVQAWKEGKRSVVADLKGERLEEWLKYRNVNSGITVRSEDTRGRRVITCAFFSKGHVSISSPEPRSTEAVQLLERFAGVFDLTYTRFLDLKNAEAQAREAQIEAAMERTRTQSMIMQHSKELDDTLRVFHQQVLLLGIPSEFSFLWLPDESKDRHRFWAVWAEKHRTDFKSKGIDYPLDRNEPATAQCLIDWKGNEPVVSYHVPPDGVQNYFNAWSELIAGVEQLKPEHFSEGLYYVEAFMKYGCFGVMISHELKEEEKKILARFATEFERTYTRFLDLQKAEAQAKEAQVEAALERVRSKTMAMHNSQDVGNTVATMFDQLVHLGISTNRCGILIFSTTENAEVWTARSNADGSATLIIGHLDVAMHPMLVGARQAWTNKASSFSYELKGDDIVHYYQSINNQPGYPVKFNMDKIPAHEFHTDFIFPEGAVFAFTSEPVPVESALILKRFSGVFGQTYRRYLDLQKAEAQAVEAIKRASVDRIRAEIASMRTTSDLERIQPLIWNELKTLGVPFIRCGVFIMDEENRIVQTMLSTPDGKAIATLHVPFDFELSLISNVIAYWYKKEMYQEYWDAAAFARNWVKLSSVRDASNDAPQNIQSPEHLYLHMLPFLQGMLYVGNNTPLKEDELKLVQNLADAFAAAYARYEDFNKLESAKQQVENTLTDLKQAQQQLIQSEKMASLGELTAGIAHEIQNPLNFVNNFSEVNAELIEEMKQEIDKGNLDEAKALADDIRDNQEKITHHGKRADGIVKGMLQHSRSSSGQKELTDINVLADEYLRLSYHGLRAKDKTFNAAMHTEYDPSIGKIAILPQDIGRVILNLITNAFYVVDEKKKASADKTYEPAVTVSTKLVIPTSGGPKGVLISVKDNGNGIPKNILDKIFQPFFTTKPTGQGTGLGLSLSYDIVKAHGGELKVETKEREGSTFIISLPC